jgi:hypothetical protein
MAMNGLVETMLTPLRSGAVATPAMKGLWCLLDWLSYLAEKEKNTVPEQEKEK